MNDIDEDVVGDDSFDDPDVEPMETRIPFLLQGVVRDRRDPRGIGRIRAIVDAIFERGTPWLWPMTSGGGYPNRGSFDVPQVNATVGVFFPLGRIGPGFYFCGGWYNASDLPFGAKVEGDRTNAVIEDAQWIITRNDIAGEGVYEIRHKVENTFIQLKADGSITLKASVGKLGSEAVSAVVMGNELKSYLEGLATKLNTHKHLGGTLAGLTGAPDSSPAAPPSTYFTLPSNDILSDKWKVQK